MPLGVLEVAMSLMQDLLAAMQQYCFTCGHPDVFFLAESHSLGTKILRGSHSTKAGEISAKLM